MITSQKAELGDKRFFIERFDLGRSLNHNAPTLDSKGQSHPWGCRRSLTFDIPGKNNTLCYRYILKSWWLWCKYHIRNSVSISKKLLKQSGGWRFSLSKFRFIHVRTVCFVRDAKSTSPCPRMVNNHKHHLLEPAWKLPKQPVLGNVPCFKWCKIISSWGSCQCWVHKCQLGQASANHSESYPLMITPTARTATHATATWCVWGWWRWFLDTTNWTGITWPTSQSQILKWESSSSLHHSFFPLSWLIFRNWETCFSFLYLIADSDITKKYVKSPFSKSGTEDEGIGGIGQASRLQNLRIFSVNS